MAPLYFCLRMEEGVSMYFEDWKEWVKKNDLDSQLLWLIGSYDRYLRENRDKWESLRNTSRVSDNYKEAVDYNNREGDAQKERYEWLLQYISENYICRSEDPAYKERALVDHCYGEIGRLIKKTSELEKEVKELKAENEALKKAMIFEPSKPHNRYKCRDCKYVIVENALPVSKNGIIRGSGYCESHNNYRGERETIKLELSRAACSNFEPREEDKEDE